MAISQLPPDLVILLLVLALIVPWRGMARVRALLRQPQLTPRGRVALYASTIAMQWIFTGITLWRCAARGLNGARLGIALPNPAIAITLGLTLALLFAFAQLAGFRGMSRVPVEQRGRIYEVASKLMPRNAAEAVVFAALVVTVSLCEEFLYRGFAFAVFLQLSHHSGVAVVGSALLFGTAHMYQGRRGVFLTFLLGMVFGAARLVSGSLFPGIIAHCVVDLLAGFVAPGALWEAWRPETT